MKAEQPTQRNTCRTRLTSQGQGLEHTTKVMMVLSTMILLGGCTPETSEKAGTPVNTPSADGLSKGPEARVLAQRANQLTEELLALSPPLVAQAQIGGSGCAVGDAFIFELATHAHASRLTFTVHRFPAAVSAAQAFRTIQLEQDEAAAQQSSGSAYRLLGVLNAGFFDDRPGNPPEQEPVALYSFYQMAPPWLPENRWQRSPTFANTTPSIEGKTFTRPCLQWKGGAFRPAYRTGDAAFWDDLRQNPQHNAFCAGPLLINKGRSVWQDSAAAGGFSPAARTGPGGDGADPLSLTGRVSRLATCIKSNGNFLVYARSPNTCGVAVPDLTEKLLSLGCTQALAHDGGQSVQYHFEWGGRTFQTRDFPQLVQILGFRQRMVPVWLAISALVRAREGSGG